MSWPDQPNVQDGCLARQLACLALLEIGLGAPSNMTDHKVCCKMREIGLNTLRNVGVFHR